MAKPKVLATHRLFEPARKILQETCDVEYWEKPERPPREEVLRRVKDKEGLICLLTEKVDDALLQAAPKLRIAANVAVGFDNIDVVACTKRGVVATNTPGVLDETTADFAWALLMAVARRLVDGDALARSGNWKGWDLDQLVGTDIWGKTLGIVGFGRIGRAMARRASGFQMKVIYTDAVRAAPNVEKELGAGFRDMNALLAEADFISLHTPLLPETRRLFDAAKFERMKR
ncbi:MAG TPA: D-glycerate dehydrogenase, partial [Candidatus Dormibacteraeota bacterium]|nr:D-glycerate dehydrogenase [Candidatus Dormibacteraeota bacterium]